jgi:hypothetical protein
MSTLKNIVKLALIGGALYGAYRLGKNSNDDSNSKTTEEQDIVRYINEIEQKPIKSKRDEDMLSLLRDKLNRLR